MDKNAAVTRNDIDEIISILHGFMNDVHERFEQIDKKFAQIDKRFESVDSHLDKIESRLDKVDTRLSKIERKIEPSNANLNTRLVKIETDTALLKKVAAL